MAASEVRGEWGNSEVLPGRWGAVRTPARPGGDPPGDVGQGPAGAEGGRHCRGQEQGGMPQRKPQVPRALSLNTLKPTTSKNNLKSNSLFVVSRESVGRAMAFPMRKYRWDDFG